MSTIWTPRPYQQLIRDHILDNRRCAVWADMGLGKTSATLSALEILWLAGSNYWPALIIAPLRVARGVWPAEVRKWKDFERLRVSPIIGTEAERVAALRVKADIYTINPENIPWLLDVLGKNWPFKIVIVDEATMLAGFRLRKGTKRSRALSAVAKHTPRFIELTGTPALNGLHKLWGQLWFLDGGRRLGGTYTEFKQRYFTEGSDGYTLTPHDDALERIAHRCKDICLTLRAKDWFDVKEPIRRTIGVELPPKARAIYKDLEREMYHQLDESSSIDVINAAALSSKCLQLASGTVIGTDIRGEQIVREVHDEKLNALDSLLNECNGAPLLVGYWWKADLARIKKRFPFAREIKTQKDEDDWNEGRIELAVGHYQSMGHGLSLQDGGHRLCHFSRWWNAEFDAQFRERLGPVRQLQSGYDRPVFEYSIVAEGTIDELVEIRHTSRREVHDLLADKTHRRKL